MGPKEEERMGPHPVGMLVHQGSGKITHSLLLSSWLRSGRLDQCHGLFGCVYLLCFVGNPRHIAFTSSKNVCVLVVFSLSLVSREQWRGRSCQRGS